MKKSSGRLPLIAIAYIAVVIAGGIVVAGLYAANPGVGWPDPSTGQFELVAAAILFMVTAYLTEQYRVPIPSTSLFDDSVDRLVVSSSVYIASLLLFGPAFTILVVAPVVLVSDLREGKPLYKAAFNAGQYVLTIGISGLFLLGSGNTPHSFMPFAGSLQGIVRLLATLASYFLLNSSLVAAVVAMVQGITFVDVWKHANRRMLLQYAGMLNAGVVAAILWTVTPLSLVLLALPMAVIYLAFKTSYQLRSETAQALIAIAGMVDARDSYAYHHSQEVARYAAQIAAKLGLPLDQADTIKLAAQLHDIGKIGTPDSVLHKAGALVGEEKRLMQAHTVEGAKVLQRFSLFRPGVELVLRHHEHYDGSGYPDGKAGDEIPLGARIIGVADAYQAMTSDRVYRKALEPNVAVARLLAGAGTQFDPRVVKAMVDVLVESGVQLDPSLVRSAATILSQSRSEEKKNVLRLGRADCPDIGQRDA